MRYDRVLLEGSPDEKIMTCLKAAGWYEGRCVDLTKVKAFYAIGGITLPKGAERFLSQFHGIAANWFFNEPDGMIRQRCCDIDFKLYPYHDLSNQYNNFYFDSEWAEIHAEDLQKAAALAGEPVIWVGQIGYYYPAKIYLGSTDRIYAINTHTDKEASYDSIIDYLRGDFCCHDEWASITVR